MQQDEHFNMLKTFKKNYSKMSIFLKARNIKIKAGSFSDLWSNEFPRKEYDNLITLELSPSQL